MKNVVILLAAMLSTGCATMVQSMYGTDNELVGKSYPDYPLRANDVDRYKSELAAFNQKVTTDEKGIYYIELVGDEGVFLTGFKNTDMDILKTVLTKSVGLMEPLYKYVDDRKLILDRPGTEARHNYLSQQVGLNLLSVSDTFKYHSMVRERAVAGSPGTEGGMASIKAMRQGNLGIYNNTYYPLLKKTFPQTFDYLVQNPGIKAYATETEHEMRAKEAKKAEIDFMENSKDPRAKYYRPSEGSDINDNVGLRATANNIPTLFDIYFVPMEVFQAGGKNISFSIGSGCRYTDFEMTKKYLEFFSSMTDIPYISTITALIKAKTDEEKSASLAVYEEAIAMQAQTRINVEKACLAGLKALDVNGYIESGRL